MGRLVVNKVRLVEALPLLKCGIAFGMKEVRNVWHEELIPEGIRETWNSNVSHCHTRTLLMKGICRIDAAGEWAD